MTTVVTATASAYDVTPYPVSKNMSEKSDGEQLKLKVPL